jgi:hypothetical protein
VTFARAIVGKTFPTSFVFAARADVTGNIAAAAVGESFTVLHKCRQSEVRAADVGAQAPGLPITARAIM